MNKINYQKELENIIEKNVSENKLEKLLIHSCCAPCSSYVLTYLSEYFDITVLYYNPNIFPKEEYTYRINEQDRLIKELNVKNPIKFVMTDYTPLDFHNNIKGYEKESEGGKRCEICFEVRLRYAAHYAKDHGFDRFTTTLSISPLKNSVVLNETGLRIANEVGVNYLVSDFKKKEGYKKSVILSKEHNLYRQDYCGCVYSKYEMDQKKAVAPN